MYTIDRIEENIVILENRETKQTIEVNKNILPNKIKEGDILDYINNEYIINKNTKEIKQSIRDRFNKLKK